VHDRRCRPGASRFPVAAPATGSVRAPGRSGMTAEAVFTRAALSRSHGLLLAFALLGVSAAPGLPGFRVLAGVCAAFDGRQMGRGSGYTPHSSKWRLTWT
jgi:hypothetical protein